MKKTTRATPAVTLNNEQEQQHWSPELDERQRIEVRSTGQFDTTDARGTCYVVLESSTVHLTARGNAPLTSRVASRSYKLRNGMYVTRRGETQFQIDNTGEKLTILSG